MRVVLSLMLLFTLVLCPALAAESIALSGKIAQPPEGWWEPIGPWGGECWNVVISPRDVDTVFAIGPAGIHRSLNRGIDWFPMHTWDMQGIFLALAFTPGNEDVIYAGGTGTGVWRSIDMGETWAPFAKGLPGGMENPADIVCIVFAKDNVPYLGMRHGTGTHEGVELGFVYRLDGDAWVRSDDGLMLNPPVIEPEKDPALRVKKDEDEDSGKKKSTEEALAEEKPPVDNPNPNATLLTADADGRLWAGVYGGGIFRLEGERWELVTKGGEGGMKPTSIAPYPGKAKRFYFGTQDDWIWYTITDGKYWKRMNLMDTSKEGALPMLNFLAIDPINPNLLWISVCSYKPGKVYRLFEPLEGQEGGGIAVTLERGEEWIHLFHHPNGHWNRMTIEPGEKVNDILGERAANLWATAEGFIGIRYSDLGIREIGDRYRGFHGEEIFSIFRDSGGNFFAATGDCINQPDEEMAWVFRNMEDRFNQIFCITQDYTGPDKLLYAIGGLPEPGKPDRRGVFRTGIHGWYPLIWPREERGGHHWLNIYVQDDPIPLLEETPCWSVYGFEFDPQLVWVGTQTRGILTSLDGGENWREYNWGLPENASVTNIVFDEAGEPLFAGLRAEDAQEWRGHGWQPRAGEPGSCWRFDKPNKTWARMEGLDGAVFQLDWSPDENAPGGGILRAATAGGLYEWRDSTSSWLDLTGGLPEKVIPCIAVDKSDPLRIFAGTASSGVWYTGDGGEMWSELNEGLFNRETWRLTLDPENPDHLWVATIGGGVFEFGGD